MQSALRNAFILFAIAILSSDSKAMAQNSVYHIKETTHKSIVDILAISSSVHVSSGSEDIYLANISFQKGASQLAKLVDHYPSNGYPVRIALLREHRTLKMKLVRHEQCDVEGHKFFLSKDPGMLLNADARTELKDHAQELIPCYTVVHDATHLAKQ